MSDSPQVPSELKELLNKLVAAVIRDKVNNNDLLDYAVNFFQSEIRERKKAKPRKSVLAKWWNSTTRSDKADEGAPVIDPKLLDRSRRKSVSAEAYDPSKAASEAYPVHPKTASEIEGIMKAVKNVLLLRTLGDEDLKRVVDALYRARCKPGENVITQGDENANEFYIIESGIFEVFIKGPSGKNEKIGEYEGQGSFGELALMYTQPRAATVTAKTAGILWALDRRTFQRVVLGAAYLKRERYMQLLRGLNVLTEMKNYELSQICDSLVEKNFRAGQKVVTEGDPGDGMYIIESGEVIIQKLQGVTMREIGRMGPGEYFGEVALITKRPRAATVIATKDCRLAFLDLAAFERLVGPCVEIMKRNIPRYEEQWKQLVGASFKPAPP